MKINELLKAVAALSDGNNTETYDLTTEKGYKDFKKAVDELRNTDQSIFNLFGIDIDEWLDSVEELGKNLYNAKKEIKNNTKDLVKEGVKQMEPKEYEEEDEEAKEDTKEQEFKRPSELLSVEQKLQLHKLVQEYVDTTIRPFNKGILTNDQINDAYAGLYEFGAWILNK